MEHEDFKAAVVRLLLNTDTQSPSQIYNIHRQLKLDSFESGFVMSRDQYNHYTTQVMAKRTFCPAMYHDTFYPKSSHMIPESDKIMSDVGYALPAITKRFPYYRWSIGPGTPQEWRNCAPKFEKLTEGPVVFLWHSGSDGYIYAMRKRSNEVICAHIFIGGGRMYCESAATKCPFSFDTLIL